MLWRSIKIVPNTFYVPCCSIQSVVKYIHPICCNVDAAFGWGILIVHMCMCQCQWHCEWLDMLNPNPIHYVDIPIHSSTYIFTLAHAYPHNYIHTPHCTSGWLRMWLCIEMLEGGVHGSMGRIHGSMGRIQGKTINEQLEEDVQEGKVWRSLIQYLHIYKLLHTIHITTYTLSIVAQVLHTHHYIFITIYTSRSWNGVQGEAYLRPPQIPY